MADRWRRQAAPDDPLRLRALLSLGPAKEDHWVALRCAIGALLPLLALLGAHRLDLAPFAVFASLTNIFGRVPSHLDRLLAQLKVGCSLWLVMLAAWLASRYLIAHGTVGGEWTLVVLTVLVSTTVAAMVGVLRIRPAGSLFHIFSFGGIAALPTLPPLGDGMLVASLSLGLALALGQLGRLWAVRRTAYVATLPRPLTPAERRGVAFEAGVHGVAVLLAGALAVLVTPWLGAGHLSWAMLSAVVPVVGHSTRHRVARGVHRLLGTAAGIAVLGALLVLQPPVWAVVLLIALGQFGAEMFVIRNYFLAQVFVTPMALLGVSVATRLTPQLLYDRAVETVIGAFVGMGAVLTIAVVRRSIARLADGATADDAA